MRTQTTSTWQLFALLFVIAFCLTRSLPVFAQRIIYNSTYDRLQTPIHLSLGETTTAQAAAALSTQTGLKIEAAAYLRDRILDVELDNMTGKAALDAIAQLNDWKWEEIGAGHIVFMRRVPPVPQKMIDIPPAIVAALPKDWRTYLYIDVPWQEAMRASGTTNTQFGPSEVRFAMGLRIKRLMNRQLETTLGSLKPPLGPGSKVPYAKLTPDQRDGLAMTLFLLAMSETSKDLLHGHFAPYELDFSRAAIEIRDHDLFIGTHFQEGEVRRFESFGIQMVGNHALPDETLLPPIPPAFQP